MKGGRVTQSKFFRPYSSFESIRKQAKKLVRQVAADDPDAIARVRVQLAAPNLPLSLRDAQLVLAREYGFAGWQDLRTAALRQEGKGLAWAAAEAERAIHDHRADRLTALVQEYPALLAWRNDFGESLLGLATGSFGDSGDPDRERTFTRIECAETLLEAGATVEPSIWEGAIFARAKGVLDLLSRKGVLPRRLDVLAALGDDGGVGKHLSAHDAGPVTAAFRAACRFERRTTAVLLLDRAIELDRALGAKVDGWRGRSGFVDYVVEHPQTYGGLWQSVVMNELFAATERGDLAEFTRWLKREPELLDDATIELQVELIERFAWKDRGPFISRLMEFKPALLRASPRPPSRALQFALEYGKSHLVPLLAPIWPLPDDLPHAAGIGDFTHVQSWFDGEGRPKLGSLAQHHPTNHPTTLRHLRWTPANAQQILDVALAWACMNRHFEIATFLLERGANVNTDWSTHEPASILHECAVQGNYEAAQFLIDHGIDATLCDYRWNATAEGWARYAAGDDEMAEFLARAAPRP
ncbi:MAG: ankyrin repeat domain-containing protein [Fimbriimonas sp.]